MSESHNIIVVDSRDGKKYKMVLKGGDLGLLTIGKVKRYLHQATGIEVLRIVISFNGRMVNDGMTGSEVGLYDGAVMHFDVATGPPGQQQRGSASPSRGEPQQYGGYQQQQPQEVGQQQQQQYYSSAPQQSGNSGYYGQPGAPSPAAGGGPPPDRRLDLEDQDQRMRQKRDADRLRELELEHHRRAAELEALRSRERDAELQRRQEADERFKEEELRRKLQEKEQQLEQERAGLEDRDQQRMRQQREADRMRELELEHHRRAAELEASRARERDAELQRRQEADERFKEEELRRKLQEKEQQLEQERAQEVERLHFERVRQEEAIAQRRADDDARNSEMMAMRVELDDLRARQAAQDRQGQGFNQQPSNPSSSYQHQAPTSLAQQPGAQYQAKPQGQATQQQPRMTTPRKPSGLNGSPVHFNMSSPAPNHPNAAPAPGSARGTGNGASQAPVSSGNSLGTNPVLNLRQNLALLAQELRVAPLELDSNYTCVVSLNNDAQTLLLTYDPLTERLYLYATVLSELPREDHLKLQLYEALLSGALLGREMAGGGVGLSMKNNLVLMSTSLDLKNCLETALRDIAPNFIGSLNKWQRTCASLVGQPPANPPAFAPAGGGVPRHDSPSFRRAAASPYTKGQVSAPSTNLAHANADPLALSGSYAARHAAQSQQQQQRRW